MATRSQTALRKGRVEGAAFWHAKLAWWCHLWPLSTGECKNLPDAAGRTLVLGKRALLLMKAGQLPGSTKSLLQICKMQWKEMFCVGVRHGIYHGKEIIKESIIVAITNPSFSKKCTVKLNWLPQHSCSSPDYWARRRKHSWNVFWFDSVSLNDPKGCYKLRLVTITWMLFQTPGTGKHKGLFFSPYFLVVSFILSSSPRWKAWTKHCNSTYAGLLYDLLLILRWWVTQKNL